MGAQVGAGFVQGHFHGASPKGVKCTVAGGSLDRACARPLRCFFRRCSCLIRRWYSRTVEGTFMASRSVEFGFVFRDPGDLIAKSGLLDVGTELDFQVVFPVGQFQDFNEGHSSSRGGLHF